MKSLHQHVSLMPVLASELNILLPGFILKDAFAPARDEAILLFNKEEEFVSIKLNTQSKTGLLFFYEHEMDRTGSVYPLFKQALNAEVVRVFSHEENRSFAIDFSNGFQLVYKLYGPLSNIILFDEVKVIGLFRQSIENDWLLKKDSFGTSDTIGESKVFPTVFYTCLDQTEDKKNIVFCFDPTEGEIMFQSNNVFEGLHQFSKIFLSEYLFKSKKEALLKKIEQALKKQKSLLFGAQTKLSYLKNQVPPDEIANILMANLHVLKKGETKAVLFDFYRNQDIEIKLKKEWSPQENAEQYYKKSKNIKYDWAQAEQQIEACTQSMEKLEKELEQAKKIEGFKELKEDIGSSEKKKQNLLPAENFKKFECAGYLIYVGKSSTNNDQLTLKFAHKEDLWLHAKGVSGSHVVIKHKGKDAPFPRPVIEFAAQLAAYYSKAKSSSLVPVIYTLKKYVRKPKGAPAGSVKVEREELLMAEPRLPGS